MKQSLQARDLTIELSDLPDLPIHTKLQLSGQPFDVPSSIASREERVRIARQQSPDVRAAKQTVERAKAKLGAAKYVYVSDLSAFARYGLSKRNPLPVHNFGTFGAIFAYELFDGGRRKAEIGEARTMISRAE